ncbi:DUF5958 family protein [Spirosoma sp. KNUC1025]|uniref:DUF5958 family protein n=1 Tax=Spirosoma sp. KNUC1025 TaxID=2894082 RepID=UPI003863F9D5|nr:DUF5958 family protein [Spirosoma sp. KNUC1025]
MSLDEEITMFQFGQSIYSQDDLLTRFRQLDENERREQYYKVDFLVEQLKPTHAEMEQATVECSLTESAIPDVVLKHYRKNIGIRWMNTLPDNEIELGYRLLLALFKLSYQRHFGLEKENNGNWRYRDLSSATTVQEILTSYRALVEDVYNNSSFRSEFVSIAKLCHAIDQLNQSRMQEPETDLEPQTHVKFVNHADIATDISRVFDDKDGYSYAILRRSVEKALARQYELDADLTRRLVSEVIDRHLQETYGTGFFS